VIVETVANGTTFVATGRLQTAAHLSPPAGEARYQLEYKILVERVELNVRVDSVAPLPAKASFVLPVISRSDEQIRVTDPKSLQISKSRGTLRIQTDAAAGFEAVPTERTFNLVPGFECIPLQVPLTVGETVRITLQEI
jgi:hypothetical protein